MTDMADLDRVGPAYLQPVFWVLAELTAGWPPSSNVDFFLTESVPHGLRVLQLPCLPNAVPAITYGRRRHLCSFSSTPWVSRDLSAFYRQHQVLLRVVRGLSASLVLGCSGRNSCVLYLAARKSVVVQWLTSPDLQPALDTGVKVSDV